MFVLEENYKKQIEDIKDQMECSKDFKCTKSGFESLCNAKKLMALEDYIECLEDKALAIACEFSIPYVGTYFCQCPLRMYAAKHFGK